jgi:hypothetical protein
MPALRLLQVSATFVPAYLLSNYATSLRADIGHGVFAWEQAIPFVEWSIVPYLSIFVLFPLSFFVCCNAAELHRHTLRLMLALALAVLCYAAFPLGFHFERPQPQGPLAPLFQLLWAADLPYNRSPSLHIAVLVLLWPRLALRLSGWQRLAAHAWLASIGASVLTTYQHHVIDIAGGLAVAGACIALTPDARYRERLAVGLVRAMGTVGLLRLAVVLIGFRVATGRLVDLGLSAELMMRRAPHSTQSPLMRA